VAWFCTEDRLSGEYVGEAQLRAATFRNTLRPLAGPLVLKEFAEATFPSVLLGYTVVLVWSRMKYVSFYSASKSLAQ
jgi:hypothetical protein